MPKRKRVDLIDVVNRETLSHSLWRAARGKRQNQQVKKFLHRADHELNRIASDVLSESYEPLPLRQLVIHDPKRRTIHAPAFRDRVLHHAIIACIGQCIENTLIDHSFACRTDKGPIAAVKQAQLYSRKHPWFLKMDIRSYFHSIEHETLKRLLEQRIKGKAILRLLSVIIDQFSDSPGKGLPIGALTSQYFANLYLNPFDRWAGARPAVRGYVRYMDDEIIWFRQRQEAVQFAFECNRFLHQTLGLAMKEAVHINMVAKGITFCGHRIFPGIVRLGHRRKRMYPRHFVEWERKFVRGQATMRQLSAGYWSAHSLTVHAEATHFRRSLLPVHIVNEV